MSNYQKDIAEIAGLCEKQGSSWNAISPESAARMKAQNRFQTGLDIARVVNRAKNSQGVRAAHQDKRPLANQVARLGQNRPPVAVLEFPAQAVVGRGDRGSQSADSAARDRERP